MHDVGHLFADIAKKACLKRHCTVENKDKRFRKIAGGIQGLEGLWNFGIMLLDGINQCFPNLINAPKLPAGVNTRLDVSRNPTIMASKGSSGGAFVQSTSMD
ncbi:hypothetical protein EMCG_04233 [[Emmonsia] crescens]|uniref:Uncharacterized protein n=1 Tax=[Emmonsia] crescens TaxID=73230 RepID=A0A0G2HSM8_9EURO|nr:hypothetical protein EMCG_04233 [Emmonsia crescens UAMH 3008]